MPKCTVKWLFALSTLIALIAASCVARPPVARLAHPAPTAVAIILERDDSPTLLEVPETLRQHTELQLSERNLVPRSIDHQALMQTLTRTRHTTRRVAKLHSLATAARLLVLIETRASFFSQLNGRYKWTVQARLSVADANALDDLLTDDVDFPAILEFDHEREAEALEKVAPLIGDRLGALIDRFLGGHNDFNVTD